uniref:coagulation factor V n=1 Tax=Monopterus albus TaxID=43700 RepID=UPI0009B41991|nr:coagulation factor V [Monopterus albus]
MRLCAWPIGQGLLPALVLLTVHQIKAEQNQSTERHYYIAAVEIDWNYSDNDTHGSATTYKKVVFREYEKDFRQAKAHPSWLGLLGPTLRAEEGDTIVVTFRNMASGPHSIHPHGVAYRKQSEGANYFDNTSMKEKEDDLVEPNSEHVYYWEVTPNVSPQPNDPTCLTYTYISHQKVVEDYNSGLIGTLLICKSGSLDKSGKQTGFNQEYIFLFGVFDEKESKYKPTGHASDNHVKYTINGYTKGSLPDVRMCAYTSVSLHLVGMSSEPEVFSVHMNAQVLQQTGHKVSSVGLISGSSTTASIMPLYKGRWLLSSHILKHMEAGMHGFVDVMKCDGFEAPQRRMTIEQKRHSREWKYYIAAEEIIWDYAPNMHEHIDEDFRFQYLRQSPTRIGHKYKKAVYTLYKNESFTERLENKQKKSELGILGPVIRAQIRDVIKIVFKNMASRPYSIYPHGLNIEKSDEGVNYPEGGNQSHGVQPGETYTYVWKVVEENEPLDDDPRCLTRMYHSAVDTPRDIASGLIGPLLICKSQSLNVRNVQLKADKEQHAVFAVFDENKSWYLDYNIRQYCDRSKVNKADPDFYKSNVMHTINGYAFESGPLLGFCNGEAVTWHVSSIGEQDYIQTATFYGHTFELNERTEDFLSLYPMTGETITMVMSNIGVWLLASLTSHETTKGMRVKFQDVECYRDYQYEYSDYENAAANKEFTEWKPPALPDIIMEEKEPQSAKENTLEIDDYTEKIAIEVGFRTLKDQATGSDAEQLDLSFLNYDPIDVPDGDMNITLNFTKTKTEDSEERFTGGHVFYVPVSNSSTNSLHSTQWANVSVSTLPQREDENNTATNQANVSTDATDHSFSTPAADIRDVNTSSTDTHNLTISELEITGNKTKGSDSLMAVAEQENGLQVDPSQSLTNLAGSRCESVTHVLLEPLHNVTVNTSRSELSGESSSESRENVTALLVKLNHTFSMERSTHESKALGNVSLSSGGVKSSSSEELSTSDSSEEVFIYLKENNTEAIKTTSVKMQGHNWTYVGVHQKVPMEIPDHMKKYFEKETPTPTPKKVKTVTLRQWPEKGQGMKTKRKKKYKPQARSGLPFSPRGFNPGMTLHGSRPSVPKPVSDEEQLINMPIVIGVPRPDFSNYELYVPGAKPQHLGLDEPDMKADEYEYVAYKDPYIGHEDIKHLSLDETTKHYLKFSSPNLKTYFIAAKEVEWNYSGYKDGRQDKKLSRETTFTKVVFRAYMDSSFSTPDIRGEIGEHLGILGPMIKVEVGQSIMVVFRNNANRPYSIHPNGVSYTKQTEGLSYEDGSKYWYKYDNEVQPNTTFTYLWRVHSMVGPQPDESDCRTWAYYSGVNPERDIHSGLIGPLLVCKEGTLDRPIKDTRDFTLLFMTFDESQSWYYEKNRETMERKNRRSVMDRNFKENLKFHSINGIIYNLRGLRMYTNQLMSWHLINMGSPKDFHSIHFHGQTFLQMKTTSYRQAVYPLLPGGFATLEMYPSKPGLWQLETEVGFNQEKGMQTLFLVVDNDCYHPLGLVSGNVRDDQITAINTRRYWEPHLARLDNKGKYNAWSTEQNNSWIQVDFQRSVVISQVATQGAKQMLQPQYVVKYSISYSTDRRKWIFYKGDSREFRKAFAGNQEAYETKKNTFFPPLIGRFIRLHPIEWYNKATVRMEFYGCELDGCSVPLGMESGLIEDHQITASSSASSWYGGPWKPHLARLNKQGTINAWQAKYCDMSQWLQVELPKKKKITGIITQGAKALQKEMYVMTYVLQYSDNGIQWNKYTDTDDEMRNFSGNKHHNDYVRNYIHPPIFSRFIRIIPTSWMTSITLRLELLGCDFE